MDRRGKSKKAKAEAKRSPLRKSPKDPVGEVRDLEKRLAEALDQLQTRNRDLTKALEQQTATSEILRVISRSQTDMQPVFDAIVGSAVRLLRGHTGALTRVAGDQVELSA
jgi:hypothetical protein